MTDIEFYTELTEHILLNHNLSEEFKQEAVRRLNDAEKDSNIGSSSVNQRIDDGGWF
jgi:hypothetical protein